MNSPAPYSALREWRLHMAHPPRIAGLLGVAAIITLIAPFETDHILRAVPRFAYWATLVVATYSTGFFANAYATLIAGPDASLWRRAAIGAVLTSLTVFAIVYMLNGLALGFWATGRVLLEGFVNVALIASIISVIFHMIDHSAETDAPPSDSPAPPVLLDRLAFDKRGALVSLSVEDHYVRVRTTQGEEMLLMRLGDAIREVGATNGLQVHRSHWVALDQVTAAKRKGDGAVLSLTHGPDIPVSRANVGKIKEAGLLPR